MKSSLFQTILVIKDIDTAVLMVRVLDKEKKNQLLNAIHSIWNDLWKESIENETFLTFFFEVQSGIIGPTVGDCD